ncbi:MAG: glycosyltransferase family 2 protein [Chloroflexi bacterium]|nr:glycosyltransferase family 2 protein [Chloroflexota bacterium]
MTLTHVGEEPLSQPAGSIVIPNFNGARHLPTCLNSLRRQTFRDFETLVIDNGSSDGSLKLLLEGYPEVRVIQRRSNRSFFSGAVNEGIRRAKGDIIVLLNNDTETEPDWLEELLKALGADKMTGIAASKMLLFDRRDVLNSAGDFYGLDGMPGNRGVWERDLGQYDESTDVFGACAGAAAYRRSMLEAIGMFDEDFVGYCEDVDVNFRARLAGYRVVFAPKARVYHRLSATGSGPLASYLCGRNFINVIIKDMPGELLLRHWRRILVGQLRYTRRSLLHLREPAARAWLRGQMAGLLGLPRMLAKRRAIQTSRKISIRQLESVLSG